MMDSNEEVHQWCKDVLSRKLEILKFTQEQDHKSLKNEDWPMKYKKSLENLKGVRYAHLIEITLWTLILQMCS